MGGTKVYSSPAVTSSKGVSILQPKASTLASNPKTVTPILQPTVSTLLQRGTSIAKTGNAVSTTVPGVRASVSPGVVSNGVVSKDENKNLRRPSTTVSITKLSGAGDKTNINGVEKVGIMNGSSSDSNNNSKTFPSLVVNVKPCLQEKPPRQEINSSRAELGKQSSNLRQKQK